MIGVTEVDFDLEQSLKVFVLLKKNIIVKRDSFELREAFLDSLKCLMDIVDRDDTDELKKSFACFPIDKNEESAGARFAGDDEIGFGVAEALSFVDSLGSFLDERSVTETAIGFLSIFSSSSLLLSVRFNLSAIRTLDEAIDTVLRDSIYGFLLML